MYFARSLLLTSTIAILMTPLVAVGDSENSSPPTEEILVTAGFRDQSLMDTSGSTSIISELVLEQRAARHLEDVILAVPNVSFTAAGSRARFIQMRGIGDLEQFVDPKHFPSVGIVMDGIELNNVATGALLLDAEQIEVLRGPQGTRFGASALAGMVNVQGKDPGDEFEAEISAGYGNFDTWYVGGNASGAINDNLRARLAIRQFQSDGYTDNAFLRSDATEDKDELAARFKVLWDITDRFAAEITAFYVDADNGYDAFSLDNERTTLSDEPGTDAQEMMAVAGNFKVDIGRAGELQFLTTYSDSEEVYAFDEDWVFRGFCDGVRCNPLFEFASSDRVERERDQITGDLRWLGDFDRLALVAGAYIHHREEDLSRERFGFFGSTYETNRYALYGQLEYAVSDNLTTRIGIRGEAFDDDYIDSNLVDTQSNATYWSGEVTIEYQFNPRALLYATLARGAKPGGVNTNAVSVTPFIIAGLQPFVTDRHRFDTETLFNKEGGIKATFLEDRISLRLAAFHTDRSDAQLETFVYDATTFIFVGILDNVDDAENYGVELELDWSLTDSLMFTARSGWLETNVESLTVFDLDINDFRELKDRDQTKAPSWQYHFGLRWQALSNLAAQFAVEGQTENFFGYYHDAKLDGYTVLNASIEWRYRDATIRGWARNLTDEDYAVHGFYFANDPRDAFTVNRRYSQFGEPRVYGVELSWAF
ncbi:MAG: TonB-dependent receptor [Gammaproteobacteria bacterium]